MFKVKSDGVKMGIDQIRIPCRNGLNFLENTQIHFDVTRDVGFADLRNSFIEAEINLNGSANSPCAQIYRNVGASAIFNRLVVRSQGRLLEEMNQYNLYANLKYLASEDEGILNKRSRLEGCAKSYKIGQNPWVTQNGANIGTAFTDINDTWRYVDRKVQIPLNCSGVFNKEQIHPCLAVPLEVSLLLEKNSRCMLVNPEDVEFTVEDSAGASDTVSFKTATQIKYGIQNAAAQYPTDDHLNVVSNLPLRVGQRVLIKKTGGAGNLANAGKTNITSINISAAGVVEIKFGNADGTDVNWCDGVCSGVTFQTLNDDGSLFSDSATADGVTVAPQTISYSVKNPRLVVPKVIPSPQYTQAISTAIAKGRYAMDIYSWTNYQQAIPGAVSNSTTIIPADLSRVKSILSVPVEQANLDAFNSVNNIQGRYLNAQQYEYQINNKLLPDRPVSLSRESNAQFTVGAETQDGVTVNYISQPQNAGGTVLGGLHTYETEKALMDANIDVKNLRFLGKTNNTDSAGLQDGFWLVGRSTGPYGTSQNLMGVSAILYLDYLDGTGNLKLLNNYVVHLRTIQLTPEGVQIRY